MSHQSLLRPFLLVVTLVGFQPAQVMMGTINIGIDFTNSGIAPMDQAAFIMKVQSHYNAAGIGAGAATGVMFVNANAGGMTSGTVKFEMGDMMSPYGEANKACRNATIYTTPFGGFADPMQRCAAMAETLAHEVGHLLCAVHDCNGMGVKQVVGACGATQACNGTAPTLMTVGSCVGMGQRGTGMRAFSQTSIDQIKAAILKLLNGADEWELQANFDDDVMVVVEGGCQRQLLYAGTEPLRSDNPVVTFRYDVLSGNEAEWEFGWINNSGGFVSPLPVTINPDRLLETPGNTYFNPALRGVSGTANAGVILPFNTSGTFAPSGVTMPASRSNSSLVRTSYYTAAVVTWPTTSPQFQVRLDTGSWGGDNGFVQAGSQGLVVDDTYVVSDALGNLRRTSGPALVPSSSQAASGLGSLQRTFGPADEGYLSTGLALNAATSFTVAFWYRPDSIAEGVLWGDGQMVYESASPSGGALRCLANPPGAIGNLVLSGIPNPAATIGDPIGIAVSSGSWAHFTVHYDAAVNVVRWFVNGVLNSETLQSSAAFNWAGKNLRFAGHDGSSRDAATGHFDDLRLYPSAVTPTSSSGPWPTGTGPLFDFEGTAPNHRIGLSGNLLPPSDRTTIVAAGGYVLWTGNRSMGTGMPATAFLNVHFSGDDGRESWGREAPPLPVVGGQYVSPGVPWLEVGHALSVPSLFAVGYPDGLALAGGIVASATLLGESYNTGFPWSYGDPSVYLHVPDGLLVSGFRLDAQFVALDTAWPTAIATSPRATAFFAEALPGGHAHIEARGPSSDNAYGFLEIWNRGSVDISMVAIDIAPSGLMFATSMESGTGGNLNAGSSIRYGSAAATGYDGVMTLGSQSLIVLTFQHFDPAVDHLIFDVATAPAAATPSSLVGSMVFVVYADGTTGFGSLALTGTNLASVDL